MLKSFFFVAAMIVGSTQAQAYTIPQLQQSCREHVNTISASSSALAACNNIYNYYSYIGLISLVAYVRNGGSVDLNIVEGVSYINTANQANCLINFLRNNRHFTAPELSRTCGIAIEQ